MEEQQHIIETFSEMASRYEGLMNNELNRFWGFTYEGFVSDFLKSLQTLESDRILDIATGTAFIPSYLIRKQKPFKKIIGLDITYQMLRNASRNVDFANQNDRVKLVCGSAHELPLEPASIDRALCCLATHHMDVDLLLSNIYRSLAPGGYAHLADAGGSSKWKNIFIKLFIKVIAFLYFIFTENFSRAIAESKAVANIHTSDEWELLIKENGFINTTVIELQSKKFWTPNPVIIKMQKPKE